MPHPSSVVGGMNHSMWIIVPRVVIFTAIFIALVYGCAGRWDLPFIWAYLGLLLAMIIAAAFVVDPGLWRERSRPGAGGIDRGLRFVAAFIFIAHVTVAALDAGRFHWSVVPLGVQIAALIGIVLTLIASLWALHVNRFYSPVVRIQSERGHHVVSTGPYAFVRHPGYASALLWMACSGPALGSWWSAAILVPMLILTLRRTILEDRYLHEHLDGYVEYAQRVRYRLIPGLW
jgi:protein-S-isoprenylcysteine O-methyltransferase Ste14